MKLPLSAWTRPPHLGDVGETALLERLQHLLSRPAKGVILGVGDDAGILSRFAAPPVWTVDTLVEDVDFRRWWATPADVGHKAAAVNLSDLAAMGAAPRGLLLSVAAPSETSAAAILAIARGVARLGATYGAPLVGGDLSGTAGPLVVTVTALGEAPRHSGMWRGHAQLGDVLAVTGCLGAAAGGLALLEAGQRSGRPLFVRAQLRPVPQVMAGRALAMLGRRDVHGVVDLSDGLTADIARLPAAGLGVALDLDVLPLASGLARIFGRGRAQQMALTGGEDFALAVALAPAGLRRAVSALAEHGVTLRVVGEVVERPGVTLCARRGAAKPLLRGAGHGFEHFV